MGIEGIGWSRNIENIGWPCGYPNREAALQAEREAIESLRKKLEKSEREANTSKTLTKKGEQ